MGYEDKQQQGLHDRYASAQTQRPIGLDMDRPQASREMTPEEKVDAIFTYHTPDPGQQQSLETVRDAAKHLGLVILRNTPRGPDQTAALRKLREAVMTANASIVLRGVAF